MKALIKKTSYLVAIALLLNACSSVYGGATNSTGTQSISATPAEVDFEGEVGTSSYRSIGFTNRTNGDMTITSLAFADNSCGAFSLFSITDVDGNILYEGSTELDLTLTSLEKVLINVRFSPIECELTRYTTNMVIYYQANSELGSETVALNALVEDNTPPSVDCESDNKTYYNEFENPTERTLPALDSGYYYLKVEKMNAFLKTTGSFASYSQKIGTEINTALIPEEDLFQPVYIPIDVEDNGDATVLEFDECLGFKLPTPITDTFFLGASISVTSESETYGTINRDDLPGRLLVRDFAVLLSAYVNNSNSLLQNPENGLFELLATMDLTTGETEENSYLADIIEETDDDGNALLNIRDNKMYGKDIRHGTLTLVGVGTFSSDRYELSNEAYQGLIENDAYLFLQIEALITQEKP